MTAIVQGTVDMTAKAITASGHIAGAAASYSELDTKAGRQHLNKSWVNVRKSATDATSVVKNSVDLSFGVAKATILVGSTEVDMVLGSQSSITRFSEDAIFKTGIALKAASQPAYIGRVTIVYAASQVSGPIGASLANAAFDKYVLKKQMSASDLMRSVVTGAAAAYSAQAIGHAVSAKDYGTYLQRAAKGVTQNMTTILSKRVMGNGGSTTNRELLEGVVAGLSSVNFGDSFAAEVAASATNSIAQDSAKQIIRSNLTKLDLTQLSTALANGFANGLTYSAVQNFVDVALLEHLPSDMKHLEQKKIDQLTAFLYVAFAAEHEFETDEISASTLAAFSKLSDPAQEKLLSDLKNGVDLIADKVSKEIYHKPYSELTNEEVLDSHFAQLYEWSLQVYLAKLAGQETDIAVLLKPPAKGVERSPAGVTEAILAIFGLGHSIDTGFQIHDLQADLEDRGGDISAVTSLDPAKMRMYESSERLRKLGIIYLHNVASKEAINVLNQYYSLALSPDSIDIPGLSRADQESLFRMAKKDAKAFYKKYGEIHKADDFYLNLAQEIHDDAIAPQLRLRK